MLDFNFKNPTNILFGKGKIATIKECIPSVRFESGHGGANRHCRAARAGISPKQRRNVLSPASRKRGKSA